MEQGIAPIDSDGDGMPNVWEVTCGLDFNNPSDRNEIAYNNYTNLENYLNGVDSMVTSTNEILDNTFTAYPTPTDGILYLEKRGEQSETIRLFNIYGENVFETTLNEGITPINLTLLNNGIYFLSGSSSLPKMKIILNK